MERKSVAEKVGSSCSTFRRLYYSFIDFRSLFKGPNYRVNEANIVVLEEDMDAKEAYVQVDGKRKPIYCGLAKLLVHNIAALT